MWRLARTKYSRDLVLAAALALATAGLVIFPRECSLAAREGLSLCGNVIIPSLFPFFVLSSLLVDLGLVGYVGRAMEGIMYPLFRVSGPCASALALGFIGGYPVGARTAISLYRQGLCTRAEAQRLLAFCNNSGPAFILGVVGAGVFGSGRVGLLLYLTHIAASCLVGLLFRFYGGRETARDRRGGPTFQAKRFTAAFTQAVTGAASSTLNICAFVVFFTVILRLLSLSGVLPLLSNSLSRLLAALLLPLSSLFPTLSLPVPSPDAIRQLLTGLVELTSGVAGLTHQGALAGQVSMAAFMLGWAGLSIHCQTLTFLADSDLSPGTYLAGKLLHGLLSATLTTLVTRFIPLSQPVGVLLSQQVDAIATLDFTTVFPAATVAAWSLLLVFFFFSIFCGKKRNTML